MFFQDDASFVLHSPAVCAEAAGGPAVVPGSPGHPDLLPRKWRMELPGDCCQNHWQGLTVSLAIILSYKSEYYYCLKKKYNFDFLFWFKFSNVFNFPLERYTSSKR